ncbi:MAG TPA: outer membrane lipoprotein carrier protein LolA [Gammaproteobacteria bacterium]|nr:outer membrane lipoprotein carrier protein LolA [Gammaproteobacteria bacterium]|tara:strand:+ start:269 stop:1015 length:747 start_codon:yes stop_codon:yes gene_type:complete
MGAIPVSFKIFTRVGNWFEVKEPFYTWGLASRSSLRLARILAVLSFGIFLVPLQVTAEDKLQPRTLLEQFLSDTSTFQAKFEQKLFDEYGNALETTTGEVLISKPGKFRWEYQKPYKQLIVADGTTLWVYDVDLEQVSINPLSPGTAGSPVEILVREVELERHYFIAESFDRDGIAWVSLTPRSQVAQYNAIEIGFSDKSIHAMKLLDNLNQLTEIQFRDIERNDKISDDYFRFEPIPGIDVMRGPAS